MAVKAKNRQVAGWIEGDVARGGVDCGELLISW
jgi:hypothetical protein